MTEVVTCMHHKITEEEHSFQEVQSKVIHVYASSSSETSFDGTCFMQSNKQTLLHESTAPAGTYLKMRYHIWQIQERPSCRVMPVYDYQIYGVCWSNDLLGQASTVQHTLLPCRHHIPHHGTTSKPTSTTLILRGMQFSAYIQ